MLYGRENYCKIYLYPISRSTHPKLLEDDPENFFPDGRYNHLLQVQERLSFLRFLLKDGQLWLCAPQVAKIGRFEIFVFNGKISSADFTKSDVTGET